MWLVALVLLWKCTYICDMYVSLMMFKCSPFICVCVCTTTHKKIIIRFSLCTMRKYMIWFLVVCIYVCVCVLNLKINKKRWLLKIEQWSVFLTLSSTFFDSSRWFSKIFIKEKILRKYFFKFFNVICSFAHYSC